MDGRQVESVFVDLAGRAAEAIMEVFDAGSPDTEWKSDGSPVTVADRNADRIIRDGLKAAFPDVPVVSEECSESHRAMEGEFFLVDPLDGTAGFRRGSREFTVNIAHVADGIPVAGIVHAPALGRVFRTTSAGAVAERSACGDAETLHGPIAPDNDRLRVVTSKWPSGNPKLRAAVGRFAACEIVGMSSSLKFCLLAVGEADLYPRVGPTMEWDSAAGHALIRAVGGDVVGLEDFRSLIYGKPGCRNPDFLAHVSGVALRGR